MPTDEELLREFYAGDVTALEVLFGRYWLSLGGLLHLCVADEEVAQALLEELYTAVYLSKGHPENHFDFKRSRVQCYFYSLAGHLSFRWLRGDLDLGHHDC
jgi:hypothetical protein